MFETEGRSITYCFFSAQYLPTAGGVEWYTFHLCKLLCARGHHAIVVTTALSGLPAQETDENGIKIFRLPAWQLLGGRLPFTKLMTQRRLQTLLTPCHIDRVIVQTRLYTLCLSGMRFAARHHLPLITIEHGSDYVGASHPLVRTLEHAYENILMSRAKKFCTHFYAVSQASADWLRHFGVQSEGVLYNAIDVPQHPFAPLTENLRQTLGLAADVPLVAFVGRLVAEKGVLQLITAVQTIAAQTGLHLVIVGDGPLLPRLRQTPDAAVHLLGKIKQNDVLSVLRQCDLFCLPSDAEGFPTSVLEAALCRCYVITSPYGGAKELICSPDYGMVLPDNSVAALCDGLQFALAHPAQCKRATESAYQRLQTHFTWNATCDALQKILQ
ncbi:MAG: glycosyltransferase family 4 protein [Ruthenibacterium sp.]